MTTNVAPGQESQQVEVYRPLSGSSMSLGHRLEQMLSEGKRITAQERFRHQRNREAYRGNTYLSTTALARGAGQLTRLAPADMLPSGRRRDTINRLRQFVDGRVALLTRQKPPHEAVPASRDRADQNAARVATRLIDYAWDNPEFLNIAAWLRTIELWAEQDGIAFANVIFDRSAGGVVSEMYAPDPQTGQMRPVTDRSEIESLMEMDPQGERLWRSMAYPRGEVVLRPVRMGALAFDPNGTTSWSQFGWVIESRRRKVVDVEREVGFPLDDLIRRSNAAMQRRNSGMARRSGGAITPDDGSGEQMIDPTREIIEHRLFVEPEGPTGEFPDGAYIVWVQDAPGVPLVQEPWRWPDGSPRCLPYYPLIPRPDGGHILRTLGTVDELYPVQVQFDRRLSQYGEYLDLVARPPLLMVGGSLRSKSVYNVDRTVHVNPGFEAPRFMTVPPDPGVGLLQALGFLENQMGDIAMQSGPVRGEAVPGIEAAAAYNSLIVQGEGQLAGTEAEIKTTTQWAVNEILRNIQWFYSIARTISMPGIDDEADFVNFTGAKVRGATWRITGSMLPKNRAFQQQALERFMQYAGGRFDVTPFAAELLEGDVDAVVSMERAQGRKQEAENIELAAVGRLKEAEKIWATFVQMRDAYVRTMAALAKEMQVAAQEAGVAPALSPQQVMQRMGPKPPRVLDILANAGFPVPRVAITDRDHMHIRSLELWMTGDAFRSHPPIVHQVAREHLDEHAAQMAQRAAQMQAQMASAAAGTPGAQPPSAPPPAEE